MSEREYYRLDLVLSTTGEEQTKGTLKAMDKLLEYTRKRGEMLARMQISPAVRIIDSVSAPLRKIESSLSRFNGGIKRVTIEAVDKTTNVVNRITGALTNPLAMLGAGTGAAASVVFPLNLAGQMEQAGIAFNFGTESAERGKKFMDDLVAYAAKTPYEFPFLREMSSSLLGTYKDMFPDVEARIKQTMRTFTAFGDAAGRTGATMSQLQLSLYGFKQIATNGTLSMEELKQVTENLGVPMSVIIKELGVAQDDLKNLGNLGIPASKAMEAILRAFEKNYGGGMEELSRTYFGMVSTLKDIGRLIVTSFGTGMAGPVKNIIEDLIGEFDYTSDRYKAFQAKVEGIGKQVGESFEKVYKRFKELFNDENFQSMSLGDKFVFVIDQSLTELINYLDGPGGAKVQSIFIKLGEIAARAWTAGLTGMVKGSASALSHGNILGSVGLAAGAGILGGGMLLSGAWGAGKGIFKAGKMGLNKFRKISGTPEVITEAVKTTVSAPTAAAEVAAGSRAIYGPSGQVLKFVTPAAETAVTASSGISQVMSQFSKFTKVAGKVAMPIAVAGELYDIFKSENKAAATLKAAGGLGGAFAGAKLGASAGAGIGAFFGGVGAIPAAAIGSIVGGIGGYFGGKWLTGKAIETTKPPATIAQDNSTAAMSDFTSIMASFNVNLQDKATDIIAKMGGWSEQSWSVTAITTAFAANLQDRANTIISNAGSLAGALGEAAARVASFSLPTVSGSFPVEQHALGGFFSRPHLGMVAEAGPEAIIPLSSSMRSRAMALWQHAGEYLGVRPYGEGGIIGSIPVVAGVSGGATNVTVPVQVSISINNTDIDYNALKEEVGWQVANGIRKALENMA